MAVGIIIGQIFNFSSNELDSLNKVLSMTASLATVFGVIVAYLALNSWRSQFKHTKLDSLIGNLEDNFSALYRSIHEYRFAQIMIIKHEMHPSSSHDYQFLQEQGNHKRDKYLELRHIYSDSFEKLSRYCDLDKESVISAYIISRDVVPVFQGLRKIYDKDNFHIADDLLTENDKQLESIWEACKDQYQVLRTTYC
jgi:hypothetical protein